MEPITTTQATTECAAGLIVIKESKKRSSAGEVMYTLERKGYEDLPIVLRMEHSKDPKPSTGVSCTRRMHTDARPDQQEVIRKLVLQCNARSGAWFLGLV
jgi:hypothetical protein